MRTDWTRKEFIDINIFHLEKVKYWWIMREIMMKSKFSSYFDNLHFVDQFSRHVYTIVYWIPYMVMSPGGGKIKENARERKAGNLQAAFLPEGRIQSFIIKATKQRKWFENEQHIVSNAFCFSKKSNNGRLCCSYCEHFDKIDIYLHAFGGGLWSWSVAKMQTFEVFIMNIFLRK